MERPPLCMISPSLRRLVTAVLLATVPEMYALGQAHSAPAPVRAGKSQVCTGRVVPQLVDVTTKAGIHFTHLAAPEK